MGRALEYCRRVEKESDGATVRALAKREYICDAIRIPYTPYAPNMKGASRRYGRRAGDFLFLVPNCEDCCSG